MVTSNRPLKVFLCYAHTDINEVKQLNDRLVNDGVDVWMDKEKLFGGSNWEYEIRKAVRDTDIFIACVSTQFTKRFSQKYFSKTEVGIALNAAELKPKDEVFIIPVRLEDCNVPKSLKTWHWVDLFEEQGYQRLILSLNKRIEQLDEDKDENSENSNISIVISGNVQGNVIVGHNNIAQFTPDNQKEFSQEKTTKEETIENTSLEIGEEKQNTITEEVKHEKVDNVEEKQIERERFEQSAWDKEKELAERARAIAQERLEKKEIAKKNISENTIKPLDNKNIKVKPFWAYSGAIFIGLLSSISVSLSIFLVYYLNSTTTVISSLISIIISLFSFGVWSVVTHRYSVFLLSYTISVVIVSLFNAIMNNLSYGTEYQFVEIFFGIFVSEFFALFIVFFLLRMNTTQKLISRLGNSFFACILLFLILLFLSTFTNIFDFNPFDIGSFIFLFIYFLLCSYLSDWFRTIIKNRFPIFFEKT